MLRALHQGLKMLGAHRNFLMSMWCSKNSIDNCFSIVWLIFGALFLTIRPLDLALHKLSNVKGNGGLLVSMHNGKIVVISNTYHDVPVIPNHIDNGHIGESIVVIISKMNFISNTRQLIQRLKQQLSDLDTAIIHRNSIHIISDAIMKSESWTCAP